MPDDDGRELLSGCLGILGFWVIVVAVVVGIVSAVWWLVQSLYTAVTI